MFNMRYVNFLDGKTYYLRDAMAPSANKAALISRLPQSEQLARGTLLQLMVDRVERYRNDVENHPKESTSALYYRTQKATGLMKDPYTGRSIPGVASYAHDVKIMPYQFHEFVTHDRNYRIFARPAPTRPRHGFVESREVCNYADMLNVYREAVLQDPDAEVIIMPLMDGQFSAVATNAGVTWGFGNDGVTGGSNGLLIPAQATPIVWNREVAGNYPEHIGIKDTCYLELVQHTNQAGEEVISIVQRRDGPAQDTQLEYIPEDITVQKVLSVSDAGGNLLEWESIIKANADKPGVVVWQNALPLSSHYAVHAIEHGIPVVTQWKPKKGDKLKASKEYIQPLTTQDVVTVNSYMKKWTSTKMQFSAISSISPSVLATAIASIHAMSRWDNSPHLLNLRAFGVTMLARYLHSALAGELRHWERKGPGRDYDAEEEEQTPRTPRTKIKRDYRVSDARLSVYMQYLKPLTLRSRLAHLNSLYEDFGQPGWDSSYGGKAWQNVALSTINLVKALLAFKHSPNVNTWREVALAANTALHTAHNNGLAVTKWLAGSTVNHIAIAPGIGFLNPIAGRIVLGQNLSGKIQDEETLEVEYDRNRYGMVA